jgi:hypothetical protein
MEKKAYGNKLLKEYNHGPGIGKESIVDKCILKNTEFNLERDVEQSVLQDTNSRAYKKAKKVRKDWLRRRLLQILSQKSREVKSMKG